MLLNYLITLLAMTIERSYRLRYLDRGTHAPRSAAQPCRLLAFVSSRRLQQLDGEASRSGRARCPRSNMRPIAALGSQANPCRKIGSLP